MTIHQIIHMVPMGDRFVTATGSVYMAIPVPRALVRRGAVGWIRLGDLQGMLVHMVTVGVMQMPVVQIVHMVPVLHRNVPAVWTVVMGVVGVSSAFVLRHRKLL